MDVYALDQAALFAVGEHLAQTFCSINGLAAPTYESRDLHPPNKPHGSYGCGVYFRRQQAIWVNPLVCARPAKGSPMQWSFPGYPVDRTPIGVLAHENGHHTDAVLGDVSNSSEWRQAMRGNKVTSYEPNASEAFAETLRLYQTNPHLLSLCFEKRFNYVSRVLGLKPTTSAKAIPRLQRFGASQAILNAASRRIDKAVSHNL